MRRMSQSSEDDDGNDELIEVDVDASEVEQLVRVQILAHSLQWAKKTAASTACG